MTSRRKPTAPVRKPAPDSVDGIQALAVDTVGEIERARVLGYQVDLEEIQDVLRNIGDAHIEEECEDCAIDAERAYKARQAVLGLYNSDSFGKLVDHMATLYRGFGSSERDALQEAHHTLARMYDCMKEHDTQNRKA